jgi:hypothetical protein
VLSGANNVKCKRRLQQRKRYEVIQDATVELAAGKITSDNFLTTVAYSHVADKSVTLDISLDDTEDENMIRSRQEIKKKKTSSLCSICDEQPYNIVILPCKHGNICHSCYQRIESSSKQRNLPVLCPFCRTRIIEAITVFY